MAKRENKYTECCRRFDPGPWDGRVVSFKDKLFLRESAISVLHIPLNFGPVMARSMERITEAGALSDTPLMMCDESSPWRSDIYIAVGKEVPGARMERVTGRFLSKVFEGPYRDSGKWVREMREYAAGKRVEIRRMYFFYTTCPSCARKYGKNYVVLMAQV